MSPALTRGSRKAIRTIAQMAVAGSATALVTALAGGLSPATGGLVLAFWGVVVTFLHNYLETAGKIPVLLATPGLVPSVAPVLGAAVGTVETEVDQVGTTVGDVTGVVTSIGGELLGEVDPPGEGGQ